MSKKKTAKKKVAKKGATKKKATSKKKRAKKKTTKKQSTKKKSSSAGRKSFLVSNTQKLSRVLKALELGHYVVTACRLGGISESVYYSWLERGEAEYNRLQRDFENGLDLELNEDERPYLEFVESVRIASAKAEDTALKTIIKAAKGDDWRAASQFLERRFYSRWGKKDRHEFTGEGGKPIQTESTNINLNPEVSAEQAADIYLQVMRGEVSDDTT